MTVQDNQFIMIIVKTVIGFFNLKKKDKHANHSIHGKGHFTYKQRNRQNDS